MPELPDLLDILKHKKRKPISNASQKNKNQLKNKYKGVYFIMKITDKVNTNNVHLEQS